MASSSKVCSSIALKRCFTLDVPSTGVRNETTSYFKMVWKAPLDPRGADSGCAVPVCGRVARPDHQRIGSTYVSQNALAISRLSTERLLLVLGDHPYYGIWIKGRWTRPIDIGISDLPSG